MLLRLLYGPSSLLALLCVISLGLGLACGGDSYEHIEHAEAWTGDGSVYYSAMRDADVASVDTWLGTWSTSRGTGAWLWISCTGWRADEPTKHGRLAIQMDLLPHSVNGKWRKVRQRFNGDGVPSRGYSWELISQAGDERHPRLQATYARWLLTSMRKAAVVEFWVPATDESDIYLQFDLSEIFDTPVQRNIDTCSDYGKETVPEQAGGEQP
jgi:hypothetical protein